MKSKRLETLAILSVSLILTGTFAVAGALPSMYRAFSTHSASSVDILITMPAIPLIFMILLGPVFDRFLPEKRMMLLGLALIGTAGTLPVFLPYYGFVFLARLLMGVGLGLINAKAISMISERYTGNERAKLLGIRQSLETLGQTALTFTAGRLLLTGWNHAFAVYGFAFLLFLMVLLFVSKGNESEDEPQAFEGSGKLSADLVLRIVPYVLCAIFLISSNSIMSLRLPALFEQLSIGSASKATTVLSMSTFAGFLGGIAFGPVIMHLRGRVFPIFLLTAGASTFLIACTSSIPLISLGAVGEGFSSAMCCAFLFNSLASAVPVRALSLSNSWVIIGCNLGGTITPFVTAIIGHFAAGAVNVFRAYGLIQMIVAAILIVITEVMRRKMR